MHGVALSEVLLINRAGIDLGAAVGLYVLVALDARPPPTENRSREVRSQHGFRLL